jgi:hypothetical protein
MVVSRGHAAEQSPSHVTDSRVGRKHLAHRGGHHTTGSGREEQSRLSLSTTSRTLFLLADFSLMGLAGGDGHLAGVWGGSDSSAARALLLVGVRGPTSVAIGRFVEENGHTFTQSERMAIAGTIVLRDIDDPQRRLDLIKSISRRHRRRRTLRSSCVATGGSDSSAARALLLVGVRGPTSVAALGGVVATTMHEMFSSYTGVGDVRGGLFDKDSLLCSSLPDPSSKETATEEKQKEVPERPPLPSPQSEVTPPPLPREDPAFSSSSVGVFDHCKRLDDVGQRLGIPLSGLRPRALQERAPTPV